MIKCDFLSSCLLRIFIIKCVEFSLILLGTAKYTCVIKTRGIFSFMPLINNSVTIESTF